MAARLLLSSSEKIQMPTKPMVTSISLTVKSPRHVGDHLVVFAHTRVPGAHVVFRVTTVGKGATATITANAAGVAKWVWTPRYSGTLMVSFTGDLTHLKISTTAK